MGLYGNIISHIPRSHFDIVKVVANKKVLDNPDNEQIKTLNNGDYVLVNYDLGGGFAANSAIDNQNYHNTVWQKGFYSVNGIPTFFAIARLHSNLVEKSGATDTPKTISEANQRIEQYSLIPIPINQIPEIVKEPEEFNNFGVATNVPEGSSGTSTVLLPDLNVYGTTSYSYLTH